MTTVQRTIPLVGAVSAPSADQRTLPGGGALAPAIGGGAGPSITLVSDATPTNGQSITITGTGFGATQGAGGVTINGTAQTVTAWSDTSITITVVRGANRYLLAFDLIVTDNAATDSNAVNVTLQPDADWAFVIRASVGNAGELETTPAAAVGDGIHWDTKGGSITVGTDGVPVYDPGITPGVTSFDWEAWVPGDGWGAMGTETLGDPYTASGTAALGGTFDASGALSVATAYTSSGSVALGGAFDASGALAVTTAYSASGSVALGGTFDASGALSYTEAGGYTSSGSVALGGTFDAAGALSVGTAYSASGTVALAGTFDGSGALQTQQGYSASGTVALSGAFDAAGALSTSDVAPVATDGHGFEMSDQPKPRRRNMVYIVPDEPRASPAEKKPEPKKPVRVEAAIEQAREVIQQAAREHALTSIPKPKRLGEVRVALKPISQDLGDWNWVSVYQRMYDEALKEQIRRELEIEDQLDEDKVIALFMEHM